MKETILDRIVAQKKKEVAVAKKNNPVDQLREGLKTSGRSLYTALKGKNNIIAEYKRASPSAGTISESPLAEVIPVYNRYASAISVLTDTEFFGGSLYDLKKARSLTRLPVLRKDFIVDEYQIYQSRKFGADAILLIAKILTDDQIDHFSHIAASLHMDAIVEVADEKEAHRAVSLGSSIIGINNRDLSTFTVDHTKTERFRSIIGDKALVVAESGFSDRSQIQQLGCHAALIGSSLMKADDRLAALRSVHTTKVKVCGITSVADADMAVAAGADFIGLNFYDKSPRCVDLETARKIADSVGSQAQVVGVFVNHDIKDIRKIVKKISIDMLQLSGDEDAEYIKKAQKLLRPVVRTARVGTDGAEVVDDVQTYGMLFDTKQAGSYGGTGKSFSLDSKLPDAGKIFIAGGVGSHNVIDIIHTFKPFAVDINSAVEKNPGQKDGQKIKAVVQAIREYESK